MREDGPRSGAAGEAGRQSTRPDRVAPRPAMVTYGRGDRARRLLASAASGRRRSACARRAVPRARRRRRAGLRAGRPRRRQDARAHAVPRAPLERQDVSVRNAPQRLRRSAGAAAARQPRRACRRRRAIGRDAVRARSLYPQLLRRRRPDGAAPGQGRERARRLPRGCRWCRSRSAIPRGFCSAACDGGTRSNRACSSQATHSFSAGLRGFATTACRESCRAPLRRSSRWLDAST